MNNRQDDVNKGQDKVFAEPLEQVGAFKFDAQVADVFENMINRSVPGYPLILDMIGVLTERFAQSRSNCYDLGCSLGASTLKIRQHMPADSHLIAVDNSAAMIDRCRANIERDHSQASTEILQQSIQAVPYTHLRAHETVLDLVCRLLLEKNNTPLLAHDI